MLVAGIVARFLPEVDRDFHEDFLTLVHELERGMRISQPRLRHRLQVDKVGLTKSYHRLDRLDGKLSYNFQINKGAPAQYVLGAAYAAGKIPYKDRRPVMDLIRKAAAWRGPVDRTLIAHLAGNDEALIMATQGIDDPHGWALALLGFKAVAKPEKADVKRAYRDLLRNAHPDTGGTDEEAAKRIAELAEARRILLK